MVYCEDCRHEYDSFQTRKSGEKSSCQFITFCQIQTGPTIFAQIHTASVVKVHSFFFQQGSLQASTLVSGQADSAPATNHPLPGQVATLGCST
jgi:hypothetical protein